MARRAPAPALDYAGAIAELGALEATYVACTYLGDARYYLALAPFDRVLVNATSVFADNCRHYHGRSEYALGQLALALADLQARVATFPSSQYADNALYYEERFYVDLGDGVSAVAAHDRLVGGYPSSPSIPFADAYLASGGCCASGRAALHVGHLVTARRRALGLAQPSAFSLASSA